MSLTQMLFVPSILFMIFVAPVWVVMHYRSKNKAGDISTEDRESMDGMLATIDKLTDRIETLESILMENHKDWNKQNTRSSDEERV